MTSMEQKRYCVRHPLDGDPPEIFQNFNYKEVTCEKVARADLVFAMRSTDKDQPLIGANQTKRPLRSR